MGQLSPPVHQPVWYAMTADEEKEWRWSGSLPSFLAHSNEDDHNIDFLAGLIGLWNFARVADARRPVKIADIGCGSAAKSVGIIKRLKDAGIRCHLDLIDSDPAWQPSVSKSTIGQDAASVRVFIPIDANDWLRGDTAQADWAMVLHVPYSVKTELLARRVCANMVPRGSVVVIS